ncbi:hypothetical protein L218DRAFT_999821 [Marasmius fiardii PR-910]|nr:hypothetical protein L218DRAFT_999821 [Marasmius fiardii PR-910]
MQFRVQALIITALAAFALAAPSLQERQQGENCREVFFPDQCASNEVLCDGAGSIEICCTHDP